MELSIKDDNDSTSSDDSLDILPDLRSCLRDVNGPDLRVGRARSALRRTHHGANADKIPIGKVGISHVDLRFQCNNAQRSG